jgi:hypothetical protein
MFIPKTDSLTDFWLKLLLSFLLFSATPTFADPCGVEIKGKVLVRSQDNDEWKSYYETVEANLTGKNTGEISVPINENKTFSFEEVNPKDFVEITWSQIMSSQSNHVLFPYDKEGISEHLAKGVIRFRFRKIDWVHNEFKKRATKYAIRGQIQSIDKIFNHAKHYYALVRVKDNSVGNRPERYKHKLLQHICQISEDERKNGIQTFLSNEGIRIQRHWYLELINTVTEKSYVKLYPAAFIRALNQWAIFSHQSYTKYNRWSDRNMTLSGNSDESFRDANSRKMLFEDASRIKIALQEQYILQIIRRQSNIPEDQAVFHPFGDIDTINMNSVGSWIADINRKVTK